MKTSKLKVDIYIGIICIILGIMISLQYKSVSKINENNKKHNVKVEDMAFNLTKLQRERDDAMQQLKDRERQLTKYEQSSSKSSELVKIMKEDMDHAKILAGIVDVKGKGITVTVDDSKSNNPDIQPMEAVAHDFSLLYLVNDLRASGAEAISINGERLVSTSEIKCAGTLIDINNVRIAPPFVVKVIGDPDMLDAGIRMKNGVYDYLVRTCNLDVSIKKSNEILIPKYKGVYTFNFAKPVVEGTTN